MNQELVYVRAQLHWDHADPDALVEWLVELWGTYLDEKPAGPEGFEVWYGGRFVLARTFRVKQLLPIPSQVHVLGELSRDGQIDRYWVITPSGHEPTAAEHTRAIRGLDMIDMRLFRRRANLLEPEDLLERIVSEDGGIGRPWWELPVCDLLAGDLSMGRSPFYRYLERFGWPLAELRRAFQERAKKGTHAGPDPRDDGNSTAQEGSTDEAHHGRDRRANVRQLARASSIGETASAEPGKLAARTCNQETAATGPPY